MGDFLTDEWFEMARLALADLPAGGPTESVQYVISGAPGGKVQFVLRVDNGKLASLTTGKRDDVSCTVQLAAKDALKILSGSLSRDVAFMRGDLKIDGDYAAYVVRLAPWFASVPVVAALAPIAAATG